MAYIGSSPTKVVSRQSANIFTYTATANQTAFTGADANGNTLACSPSDIMVHMNGIKLEESDYTATTTTVTLGSGAAAGDEVTITAFLTFESADHYTKSAADTRYVNASGDTMSGDLVVNSQKVAIGHTSPSASDWNNNSKLLHVKGNDTDGAIVKVSSSNADGVLAVGDNQLQLGTTSDDPVKIYTNSSQRLTVDSDGLKFGTDTAATNALNKYEEGSFTYTINVGTSGYVGTIQATYTNTAYYTKIGKLVCVQYPAYAVQGNAHALYSYTLPFTSARQGTGHVGEARGSQFRYSGTVVTTTTHGPYGYFDANDTVVKFGYSDTSQDFSGYVYYPTSSGSSYPKVTVTYQATT